MVMLQTTLLRRFASEEFQLGGAVVVYMADSLEAMRVIDWGLLGKVQI